MERKGQAAMEFLMTYGWAILAAIIAIGVLAYFGVFSPGKYVPSATVVSAPFYATGANAKAAAVTIEVRNNGGEDVTITDTSITGCTSNTTSLTVVAGAVQVITVPCTLTVGNAFKEDITITYRKAGSGIDLTSTGTVAQKVTA